MGIVTLKKKGHNLITFIGAKQAREGYTFIHQGHSPQCERCEYYQVCIKNLEVGRVYEVIGLRDKVFPCDLHEAGVHVVEVIESDISTSLLLKHAIEGVVITYQPPECNAQTCKNHEICFSPGLRKGDRCTIVKINENILCPNDLSLVKVVLHRLLAS
jgi:uncharacterized protein (UPF0179 family)